MDIFSGFLNYVVPFVLVLSILVFVHELGHYLVARWNGVKVETFSIGFGPEIFGWTAKSGTRWKVSAVPLGGFVKMYGDADPASTPGAELEQMTAEQKAVSFHHKRLGQRAAIVAAGPGVNFLFAILLLSGLYAIVGQPFTPAVVDEVVAGSAAAQADLRGGDRVVSVDGKEISRFEELQRVVQDRPGQPLAVVVERGGQQLDMTLTPQPHVLTDRFGNERTVGRLGVQSNQLQTVRHDPFTAVWQATKETVFLTGVTLKAVGQIIVGTRSTDELGGPLRIGQMSGEVAQGGIVPLIWFMAILSINLGLINLFPIPVLDGGHLLFYAAEAVRGKPLGQRVQEYASMAGLALVVALMVFATWNDLVQLRVVEFLGSLIG
ncbi:RIP metalloprotease RseP [Oceanibaculum pacificum]|uniref:Zinc metalloprotease n=1 Tax=Oceanibaculum pacificum TaxID=580166 RepID=A0A154W101_9PROT|nr:RIP metalloprotease RseP [Oceanibaculum pacificum]KZD07188.1 RIP metalloprotease RseP [Oceanibaculum pacificum]